MTKVSRPIIIVGTGRNGSTLLHKLLCEHPNLGWLSIFTRFLPRLLPLSRLYLHLINIPLLSIFLRKANPPSEAYPFWQGLSRGFANPCRDLTSADVTERDKRRIRESCAKLLTKKRYRLLLKITGWGRIGFLNEVFPDALFIHLVRDGRAFVNSTTGTSWWKGWAGPQNWQWGLLSEEQLETWEQYERSYLALAGIQWRMLTEEIERSAKHLGPDRYLLVRYEDLCGDANTIVSKLLEFAALAPSPRLIKRIRKYNLENRNNKWREDLTQLQQDRLQEQLDPLLSRFGYT